MWSNKKKWVLFCSITVLIFLALACVIWRNHTKPILTKDTDIELTEASNVGDENQEKDGTEHFGKKFKKRLSNKIETEDSTLDEKDTKSEEGSLVSNDDSELSSNSEIRDNSDTTTNDLGSTSKEDQVIPDGPKKKIKDHVADTEEIEPEGNLSNKNVEQGDEQNEVSLNKEDADSGGKNESVEEIDTEKKEVSEEAIREPDDVDAAWEAKLNTVNPLLYVENVTVPTDSDKVLINLNIKNNPGVLGMVVSVYFDEKSLSLSKVKNGNAVDEVLSLTTSNALKSGSIFVWDGQSITKNDISDGSMMEMEFSLLPGISVGKYPIKIVCESGDAVDGDLQSINFETVDGFIKVK